MPRFAATTVGTDQLFQRTLGYQAPRSRWQPLSLSRRATADLEEAAGPPGATVAHLLALRIWSAIRRRSPPSPHPNIATIPTPASKLEQLTSKKKNRRRDALRRVPDGGRARPPRYVRDLCGRLARARRPGTIGRPGVARRRTAFSNAGQPSDPQNGHLCRLAWLGRGPPRFRAPKPVRLGPWAGDPGREVPALDWPWELTPDLRSFWPVGFFCLGGPRGPPRPCGARLHRLWSVGDKGVASSL